MSRTSRNFSPLYKGESEGVSNGAALSTPPTLPLKRGGVYGFTLIESLVIVSIIAIFAALSLAALPAARAHQQLIADTQLINSLLLDSKQRAINQVRPDACISRPDPADPDRAPCSDIGIRVNGKQLIQFADTNENNTYNSSDYKIITHTLSTTVQTGSASTVLFRSVPPSVITYRTGSGSKAGTGAGNPMEPESTATITLKASNGTTRTLTIRPFGTVDIQTPTP